MPQPKELRVPKTKTALQVTWDDGSVSRFPASLLRMRCQSAGEKRRRLEGRTLDPAPDLKICDITAIGVYAVNIAFSDGHARGIYPWSFLYELAHAEDEASN